MRAVIYIRVSSEMQLEGFSLEAQEEVCRNLIKARGWTFVKLYRDEGISAKTAERPAFQAMLADARAGRFDAVVVHKLDRFSRSVTDLLLITKELETIRVAFVSATEQFDFTTPIGKVLFTLLAAFAQWYLDNLSMETAKGHHARASAGHRHGNIPYGYYTLYMKEGGEGLALIDEHAASGVRLAFNAALTQGDTAVAQLLNQHGYRPAGRSKRSLVYWTKDSVSFMLQNPFYTGVVKYRDTYYEGLHEPIITPELFEAVQVARRSRQSHKLGSTKGKISLLGGIAYCAGCGLSMRVIRRPNGIIYYACQSSRRGKPNRCLKQYTRGDDAHTAIHRIISTIQLPADWREEIIYRLTPASNEAAIQEHKLKALRTELGANKTMFRLGHISEAEYMTDHNRLTNAIKELETPAQVLEQPIQAGELLANIYELWMAATDEEQRALLVNLFDEIIIDVDNPDTIVAVRLKPALEPVGHYIDKIVDVLPPKHGVDNVYSSS